MKPGNPACALCLAWFALAVLNAGCGGFSSGGAPGFEAPSAPEFSRPEIQGTVEGTLRIAPGFLSELVASLPVLPRSESPEEETTGSLLEQQERDGAAVGAADVYQSMRVVLVGTRRRRMGEVAGDGSFEVPILPQGEYQVRIELGDRELAVFPVLVASRQTTQVRLDILGFDFADLDGDGSREDLTLRLEVRVGREGGGAVRIVEPDGSVRARLANGATEYLLPGGLVRREEPGGGASFREDHDLDGIEDRDDVDFRRLRVRPERPDPDQLLLGKAFPPLLRQLKVTGPFGEAEPGDLMLFQVELAQGFGSRAEQVEAALFAREGDVYRFALRDDGGREDLSPTWPGHQPSGDLVAGDGVFSHLVPVDPSTRSLLHGRQLVVVATDAQGRASNRLTLFLYREDLEGGVRPVALQETPPWRLVRDPNFFVDSDGGLVGRFLAAQNLVGTVATLLGPGGFRRVFSPGIRSGEGGWREFETRSAPLTRNGIYYLVVGAPGGQVFFYGRFLDREVLQPMRTGG